MNEYTWTHKFRHNIEYSNKDNPDQYYNVLPNVTEFGSVVTFECVQQFRRPISRQFARKELQTTTCFILNNPPAR